MQITYAFIALFIYFALLLFAVFRDRQQADSEAYFFASHRLPFWALSITFIASWWGAGSALSTADLGFTDGIGAFWYYGVPVLLSSFFMFLMARAIRRLPYATQGQMMEARYSPFVARLSSVFIFLFMTFAAASQVVGVGNFFGNYLGLSYEWAVLLGTGIVVVYSLFGGFRGVVLTDIIQFVLLLISALIVFVVAWRAAGGLERIAALAEAAGRQDYLNFTGTGGKYLSYVFTFSLAWSIQANVWQRISAARSVQDARKMTLLSFILFIPLYMIVVLTGMAAQAFLTDLPEGGVVAAIVSSKLSPFLATLVFVGIAAAIMSTMDSLINTGALTLTVDLWQKEGSEAITRSRPATAIVSLIALVVGLKIRSILDVTWIASDVITTGLFVPLLMGFVWRRGNNVGAIASMLSGLTFTLVHLAVSFGLKLSLPWELHSAEQILAGMGLSLVVYVVASLLTPADYEKADRFRAQAFEKA